jgi:hypothetical protein
MKLVLALAYYVLLSVMNLLRQSVYRQKIFKYVIKKVLKTLRYEFNSSSGLFCTYVSDEPFAIECV